MVSSYTHPEYALTMAETFERIGAHALLLRGTEGEPVADARRMPRIEAFRDGQRHLLQVLLRASCRHDDLFERVGPVRGLLRKSGRGGEQQDSRHEQWREVLHRNDPVGTTAGS